MKNEALIIGGGPIGLFLASKTKQSIVLEHKTRIGIPTRCTGILTTDAKNLLSQKTSKEITQNIITQTRILGPKESIQVKISPDYIINNRLFEEKLYDKALQQGAQVKLQKQYIESQGNKHKVRNLKTKKIEYLQSNTLFGADGPRSQIRNKFFSWKQKQYFGIQMTMKQTEVDENTIDFYPHIGNYAWSVPEGNNQVRIGLCAKTAQEANQLFHAFKQKFKGKVLSQTGGVIPLHQPFRKTHYRKGQLNVQLIGDAAGHIKNTTGGGLIPSMKIVENIIAKENKKSPPHKRITKELYVHFLVHNTFRNCNQKEWDQIIRAAKKQQNLLEQINRDQLIKMIPRAIQNKTFVKIGLKKFLTGQIKLW